VSVDPLTAVGSMQQLAAAFSNLGPALASAARTGSFGAVLSQVNSELAAVAGGSTPQAASGAGLTASSLLSSGSGASWTQAVGTGASGAEAMGTTAATGTSGSAVVSDAQKYLGVPYQWGGTDPATGLDCSGLVQRVYEDLGVQLPRTSEEQAQIGTPVSSLADAQPGDLVFFAGSDGTPSSPGHVGIYVGNGMMIDAPHTGTDVQVQPVGDPVAIRRVLSPAATVSAGGGSSPLLDAGLPIFQGAAGSATARGMDALGVPPSLQPLLQEAGQRYGVDPLLLASVAKQESGFQPGAVSPAGAVGLMQLMPATAAGLGVNPSDPASAIDGAAQLLSGYLGHYGGSVPLALAAYNAGPGAVSEYGGVPPYGETQAYVRDITSMLAQAGAAASGVVQ
jgi:cell wall-associated NlpC family hydrolase